jgi:hypothetical protein
VSVVVERVTVVSRAVVLVVVVHERRDVVEVGMR